MERRERKELERYVAASIGFCFKHNPKFRQHFCEAICGIPLPLSTAVPDDAMEIEPANWSDLRLSSGSTVHVIECKVGAPLKPHQNPELTTFFKKGGYGERLAKFAKDKNSTPCYVVLGADGVLKLPAENAGLGIVVSQRRWSDLAAGCLGEPLVNDLVESLGNLDIEPFTLHQSNNMKVTKSLEDAPFAYTTLEHTAKVLGLIPKFWRIGGQRKAAGEWSFGIDVFKIADKCAKGDNQQRLDRMVKPKTGHTAWFGYQSAEGGQRLAVWLYCGSKQQATRLQETLARRFAGVVVENEPESGWHNVIVATKEHELPAEFFRFHRWWSLRVSVDMAD